MTICSFVGDESLKNIFHLSDEEAVKHPDYNKYIRVLSKAIIFKIEKRYLDDNIHILYNLSFYFILLYYTIYYN